METKVEYRPEDEYWMSNFAVLDGDILVPCKGRNDKKAESLARMCAAAPAMYEALKQCETALNTMTNINAAYEAALAALAEAGEP